MKSVSILIPNYHCQEAIELTVESIRKYTNPEDYKMIVHNDMDPRDMDYSNQNAQYLKGCEKRGWLEYLESEKNIGHGSSVGVLIDKCDTDLAVFLDCDIQILRHGWLEEVVSLFRDEKDLLFCTLEEIKTAKPSLSPWLHIWFMALNMKAYRDGMEVDWSTGRIDGVWWNVGARLLHKVRDDNPKGYRIQPMPKSVESCCYHYAHVSCIAIIGPNETPSFIARHNEVFAKIREELATLRRTTNA